jgi:hypothetical protein
VQFIHTKGAAEVLQNLAAVLGQIELAGPIAEEIVDEPRGEVQQVLAPQRLDGPFDVHAVLKDALKDQIADLVIVEGPGEDTLGGVTEGGAAITPGLILTTGDLQIGDGLVDDGANLARRQLPFAMAVLTTRRARGLFGCAVNRYSDDRGCIGAHVGVLSW